MNMVILAIKTQKIKGKIHDEAKYIKYILQISNTYNIFVINTYYRLVKYFNCNN